MQNAEDDDDAVYMYNNTDKRENYYVLCFLGKRERVERSSGDSGGGVVGGWKVD